jgi:hypothetical protein
MTRLELMSDSRFELRSYIAEIENSIESLEELLSTVNKHSEATHIKSIRISLAKDLINVYLSTSDDKDCEHFQFLEQNKQLFQLTDEELKLALDTVKADHNMLKDNVTDDMVTKSMKELAAKAGAVGVPLAAVYMSGSVIGMSAAGITSGLATLGMGGVLGFSGMATGIGTAVILGVMTYKGVKHLTGANELEKFKRRELMLQEVIKQTQRTITLVIDDLNFVIIKLNETITKHGEQSEKIKKLMTMVAQFQGALKTVDTKSNQYQNSAIKLKCPIILDVERLKALTSEPMKKPLYDFIIENYEEKVTKENDKDIVKFIIKQTIKITILDELVQTFQAIGYFDMESILKAKASEGFNMVKGLFG